MAGTINVNNFLGMTPIMDDGLLPNNAAAYAKNAWLYSGVLTGYRPKTAIHTNVNPATKSVYRIPLNMDQAPAASFANSTWMEFTDEFVDVLRTPVVDDLYQRFYWARPNSVPQYNTQARIQAGSPAYTLGIPSPASAPSVSAPQAAVPVVPAALTAGEQAIEKMYIAYFNKAMPPDSFAYWNAEYAAGMTLTAMAPLFAAANHSTLIYPMNTNWMSTLDADRVTYIKQIFGTCFNRAPTGTTSTGEIGTWNTVLTGYQTTLTGTALADATRGLVWQIASAAADGAFPDLSTINNKTTVGGYFTKSLAANNLTMTGAAETLSSAVIAGTTSVAGTVTSQETAINAYVANPTASTALTNEVRAYVYTWVSEFGEEGPPSPPTIQTGLLSGGWVIGLSAPTANNNLNRSLTKTRVYRTVTASTGIATFYFVAEFAIAQTTYTDDVTDDIVAGNELLQSTNWIAPPIALQGMVAMPNGIFAGWYENNVYFCEPYRPHAWPAQYSVTTDFPIVGMGVVGQTLVVTTKGNATVITGVHPAVMTEMKLPAFEPCVSRGSIVSGPRGVIYMSRRGLIMVNSSGSTNATAAVIDERKWIAQVDPYNCKAGRHGAAYMSLHAPAGAPATGFTMDTVPVAAPTGQVLPTVKAGFSWLSDDQAVANLQTDPWTGELFLVTNSTVYWFDPPGAEVINPYVWTSKIFQLPKVDNLAAAKIYFDVPAGTAAQGGTPNNTTGQSLAANQYGILDVYADDVLVSSREIRTSGELIRLPSGHRRDNWQFRITARVIISDIQIASSVKELARV